jgi:predicted adenylyl cyclase CyaB
MKNIELKVAVDKFDDIVDVLKKIRSKHKGKLHQVDTYYKSKSGRIKIREINRHRFELISYHRPDEANSKISDYNIIPLKKNQVESLKAALSSTLGEKNIVKKDRDLWIYKNTRIHLDNVHHLGKFLELETVVKDSDMEQFRKEHEEIINLLHLSRYKKCRRSYGELVPDRSRRTLSSNKIS